MKYLKHIYPILGFSALILVWWLTKVLIFPDSIFLPSPEETFYTLFQLIANGALMADFVSTMKKFIIGYCIAILVGVPIGFFLGSFSKLYATFEVVLDFFRSIPVTTLFPLFILYFGIGQETIIAMVAAACIFVIILNTAYGVFYTKKEHVSYLKMLGSSKSQTFFNVVFPSSLPFLFVGLRTSVSFALIVVIVAEMFIGANDGLGIRVYEAYETYLIPDVYAVIFFVGMIGFVFNKIFQILEKRIIHWK